MFIVKQINSFCCHRLLELRKDRYVRFDILPNGLQNDNVLAKVIIANKVDLAGQKRCIDYQVVRCRVQGADAASWIVRQIKRWCKLISRIKLELLARQTGLLSAVNVITQVVLTDNLYDGAFARLSVR